MKFPLVVFLIFVYLEFDFQCVGQFQNPSADLTPQEPSGNLAEFPKNTPPSRENNQSSSDNPKL